LRRKNKKRKQLLNKKSRQKRRKKRRSDNGRSLKRQARPWFNPTRMQLKRTSGD